MRIVFAMVLLFAMFGIATAEQTGNAVYSSPNEDLASWLNEQDCITHNHQYSIPDNERNDPYGLGADVIVWENKNKTAAVEVQAKYDIANEEKSGFVVAKVNLWEMFKKDKPAE